MNARVAAGIWGLLVLLSSALATASPREIVIPVVDSGPALDGNMGDPLWKRAAVADGFVLGDDTSEPEAATTAFAMCDADNLYVAFECEEPGSDDLVAEAAGHDSTVWQDDCVELLLDPPNGAAWMYHWIVNSKGAIWDGIHASVGAVADFDGDVHAKTYVRQDAWLCELAIPFETIGARPQPGEVWGINFGRERKTGVSEISAWSPCGASFTDVAKLGRGRFAGRSPTMALQVDARGGVGARFNEHDLNTFSVSASNTGREGARVGLEVAIKGIALALKEAQVGPGETRLISLDYGMPSYGAPVVDFLVRVNGKDAYHGAMRALPNVEHPIRTWVVDDPLFGELLGDEPPGLAAQGALMWTHSLNTRLMQETAKRFALRYVTDEAYRDFGAHGLIAIGGGLVSGERARYFSRHGVNNLAYLKAKPPGIPWELDPASLDLYISRVEELLSQPHPHLWGIYAGDELDEIAIAQGAGLMADPPEGYEYLEQANEQVKRIYGGGKWGIPEGMSDRSPYKWIAYHKWALARLRERHRRLRETVQRLHPGLPIVSTDPVGGIHGFEFSRQAPFFDIFTHQYLPRQKRWRQYLGFLTKVLVDLTGKEVWPCAHIENYGMATTPEETVEELSQVLRNGGHGYHFYMPDTANGSKLVGDTRVCMFGSPARWQTVMNIIDRTSHMPRPRYPTYSRTGIVYNDDCLQTQNHKSGRTHWYRTEACYTFLGPIARSWFRFVDCGQILDGPALRDAFDVLYLPTAQYQQPEVATRVMQFVRDGGTLVCGDPMAFQTDTIGNDTSARRAELFGVEVGEGVKSKVVWPNVYGIARELPVSGSAFELGVKDSSRVTVLADFDTGSPAITSHAYGKGRAILFGSNPFVFAANEDPEWRTFFMAMIHDLGSPIGLDIWRFKFPDTVIPKTISPRGRCLTNNNVQWREECAHFPHNTDTGGSYSYSVAPNRMPDSEASGAIPFPEGKLTDRRSSIKAEKTKAEWYAPYKEPAGRWMVSWSDPGEVSVTYDLKELCRLRSLRLWFTDTMPDVRVEGSVDGRQWASLGGKKGRQAGRDVRELWVLLRQDTPCRYVRATFAPRAQAEKLSIVETELWGSSL